MSANISLAMTCRDCAGASISENRFFASSMYGLAARLLLLVRVVAGEEPGESSAPGSLTELCRREGGVSVSPGAKVGWSNTKGDRDLSDTSPKVPPKFNALDCPPCSSVDAASCIAKQVGALCNTLDCEQDEIKLDSPDTDAHRGDEVCSGEVKRTSGGSASCACSGEAGINGAIVLSVGGKVSASLVRCCVGGDRERCLQMQTSMLSERWLGRTAPGMFVGDSEPLMACEAPRTGALERSVARPLLSTLDLCAWLSLSVTIQASTTMGLSCEDARGTLLTAEPRRNPNRPRRFLRLDRTARGRA